MNLNRKASRTSKIILLKSLLTPTNVSVHRNLKRWKICKFLWANKTGDYDPLTGRYDGAIGMLMDGLADSYIRHIYIGTG